jgi:hypothetical protein
MTFSPRVNVGLFVQMSNFGVMFKNKCKRGDWMFNLRFGPMTIIQNIDPFPLVLNFVPTYTSERFMQLDDINDLVTIEMVISSIYECLAKSFIMFVVDGEGNQDTQANVFFS